MPVDDVSTALPLFDDNPAEEDLLGFDAMADVVTRIVAAGGPDPVTVGIHSAWGGGESTALNLIDTRLATVGHVVVVRIDPWEFENTEDLRGNRGYGRREIRTLKILSVAAGIEFPHAAQAIQIRRRRRLLDEPKRLTTETVYAITDPQAHQAKPWQLADWIRRH